MTGAADKRYRISSLRWGLVPYTAGSGLVVGGGEERVFPNAINTEVVTGPGVDLCMPDLNRLPLFADGVYDWVLLGDVLKRVAQPREILAEAWRVLRTGGFLAIAYPNAVPAGWVLDRDSPYRDVGHHVTLEVGALRVDVFEKLAAGAGRHAVPRVAAEKTCAVVRWGGMGDALWAASILPALKAAGYHVTVYVEEMGEQVLRHDPHADQLVVSDAKRIPNKEFGAFFAHEKARYDRFINLVESVEKNLIAVPSDLRFFWPDEERRRVFGRNYLEAVHDLAGVPRKFAQRFYPTAAERLQAHGRRAPGRKSAVYAISGSTLPKLWPHTVELVRGLIARGYDVWVVGELRHYDFHPHPNLHVVGTDWSVRETLAFALQADLVVGQETGVLNAVALEPMRKVVLLSHSNGTQLTRHWANTVALHGTPACWPCHRVHYTQAGWGHCNQDAASGLAKCQATILPEHVLAAVDRKYVIRAAA